MTNTDTIRNQIDAQTYEARCRAMTREDLAAEDAAAREVLHAALRAGGETAHALISESISDGLCPIRLRDTGIAAIDERRAVEAAQRARTILALGRAIANNDAATVGRLILDAVREYAGETILSRVRGDRYQETDHAHR